MTPQKLRVLQAHTTIHKLDDFCQNIRQDFDIYRNIDNQKAKEQKKKQKKKQTTHTNKQATKQINKRTNKETNKQPSNVACFFLVRCNDWSHCVRPNETHRKKTSKQSCKPTQTHGLYM